MAGSHKRREYPRDRIQGSSKNSKLNTIGRSHLRLCLFYLKRQRLRKKCC